MRGELVSVDVEHLTLVMAVTKRRQTSDVTVSTDSATEFILDGEAVTIADLKPGMMLTVLPDTGTATRVTAKGMTAKEEKARREKAKEREKPADDSAEESPTTWPTTVPIVR